MLMHLGEKMIVTWIVLLFEGFICFIIKAAENPDFSDADATSMIIVIVSSMVAVIDIVRRKEARRYKLIFLGAFAFRMFLFFWDWKCRKIFILPNSGQDTETFAIGARNYLLYGNFGRGGFYSKCIANLVYRLFGVQRFVAQYANVLLGMETIFITRNILKKMSIHDSVTYKIICIMAFLPNLAITNSILLRETIMIYLIALSMAAFIKWFYRDKKQWLLISIVLPVIAMQFHSGAMAPAVGYIGCALLYNRRTNTFNISIKTIIMLVMVFFAFQVLNTMFGASLFGSKLSSVDSVEDITATADAHASGASAYNVGISTGNTLVDMTVNTPIRMFYFVMSPLPWAWRGLSDIIAFVFSAAVYGYCYVLAYKQLKKSNPKNKNMIIVCLFVAVASALVFAWGVSNAGTALRHRDKFVCPYMVLMGLCWNETYRQKIEQLEMQRRQLMEGK